MAAVKPLKLKQQKAPLVRAEALLKPIAKVLVDHHILHLDQYLEYLVPEELSSSASIGTLVEVELSHHLTQGIVVARYEKSESGGELKTLSKVLSGLPYMPTELLGTVEDCASLYGSSAWDFIRSCVPPYSRSGEKVALSTISHSSRESERAINLPAPLVEVLHKPERILCAVELPVSNPYWQVLAEIIEARSKISSVLVLLPNERELSVIESELLGRSLAPISARSTDGKSERYSKYLLARLQEKAIILGTRSSALMPLPANSTIILLDDCDESHYERKSPSWNTRELAKLRERDHSVLYVSATISLEISSRVSEGALPLFRFAQSTRARVTSAEATHQKPYFKTISEALKKGSVLISMSGTGYVTSFSCQKCRNIALCSCGGKLFLPGRGKSPECATCSTKYLEWKCSWCGESKPRTLSSGVLRRADEYGKAFPGVSIIASSADTPTLKLPEGSHLVLSTPGVEPRGIYEAIVFLDLEYRLLRTTLRASEEMRLHIMRSLTMLNSNGSVHYELLPSDPFLQSILRGNLLIATSREIEERDAVHLAPHYSSIILSSEDLLGAERVLSELSEVEIVGPFVRNKRNSLLLKVHNSKRNEVVKLLTQVNRVRSLRREPLLTYQIDPYSLN